MIEVRGERVLLVEDDADTREVLTYTLAHEGFIVMAAPDGERGLELARAWRPDVVLVDVLMPRLSGVEMADAMRRDPTLRHLPIVSMSACPGQVAPRAANAHVPKPFAIGEIVAALRATLGAAAPLPPGAPSAQG